MWDRQFELTPPDNARIAAHYVTFFPDATRLSEEMLAFVARCRASAGPSCSMATVQGLGLQELARRRFY
jgi:hypothetical protein